MREYNLFKEQVSVSPTKILYVKALDLNPLYQLFIIGVQCVQHINKFMMLFVRCGKVKAKQRIKFL